MMNIFTTSKARILFVSVPEIKDKDYWTVIDDRFLVSWNNSYNLPNGQWQFLSLLKDADEEQAASVVDDCPYFAKCWTKYDRTESIGKGATVYNPDVTCWTSVESLHSLANHLGCEGNQAILIEPNK